jgi:hypothetical protein
VLEVRISKTVADHILATLDSPGWQGGMVPYLAALREKTRAELEDVDPHDCVAVAKKQADARRIRSLLSMKATDVTASIVNG